MVGVAVFFKHEFERFTAEHREEFNGENGSASWQEQIEMLFPKRTQTKRNQIQAIAETCGLVAIVEDFNGIKWVVGYDETQKIEGYLELQTNTSQSGKGLNDNNSDTIVLQAQAAEKARTFTGTVPV